MLYVLIIINIIVVNYVTIFKKISPQKEQKMIS